jgi:2-amino-4-hydroxy-6-hydroxymethyldihydropteridine diphosphokinase
MIAVVFYGFNRATIDASMTGYIALGSNLGDRRAHLQAGLAGLCAARTRLTAVSSVWETEPVDIPDPRLFWNIVVRIETDEPPHRLLDALLLIERASGRVRDHFGGSRTLDLDLLMLGDVSVDDERLTLPHRRMWERSFVLAPLNEIAPRLRNPKTGRTVADELTRIARPTRVCSIGALDQCPTVLL